MKLISELPEPYRYLADLRRDRYNYSKYLSGAFIFERTVEGEEFWQNICYYDKLPPLKPRYRIKGSVITKMW